MSREAAIARRTTERDRWVLRMLHEHTVLTTDHLARLGFASLRAAQLRLRTLHDERVLDRFQPFLARGSAPMHHLLGPVGARILAAEHGIDLSSLGWRRDRGLAVAHRPTLRHDTAVADLVVDLATHPALYLTAWWSTRRCARVFGHHVRPDAYLTLVARQPGGSTGWWEMFVEFDTGTEDLSRLAAKLDGYHRLAATTTTTTPIAFWFTRPGREPHARAALAAAQRGLPRPELVPVLTGTTPPPTARLVHSHGRRDPDAAPAGPTWLPLHPGGDPRGPHGRRDHRGRTGMSPRSSIADLAAAGGRVWAHTVLHRRHPAEDWSADTTRLVDLGAAHPYPPPVSDTARQHTPPPPHRPLSDGGPA